MTTQQRLDDISKRLNQVSKVIQGSPWNDIAFLLPLITKYRRALTQISTANNLEDWVKAREVTKMDMKTIADDALAFEPKGDS